MKQTEQNENMENQKQHSDVEAQPHGESTVAVVAAILANIAIGVVKFIASAITGSPAMFSEGVHSIVDSGNGLLVLLGIHRAKKPANFAHPFGYGKELYFWTLVVSILIFALGGGVSMWEGIRAVAEVGPNTVLEDPTVAYIILVISMAIEGFSLSVAIRQFNAAPCGTKKPFSVYQRGERPFTLYGCAGRHGSRGGTCDRILRSVPRTSFRESVSRRDRSDLHRYTAGMCSDHSAMGNQGIADRRGPRDRGT